MNLTTRNVLFALLAVVATTACKVALASDFAYSGFSPAIAIALFSGMLIKDKNQSFFLPLLALFVSDVVLEVLYRINKYPFAGLYKYQLLNYALLLGSVFIGWAFKGKKLGSVVAAAVAGPTLFFLLSNLTVWIGTTDAIYPKTFNGLMLCYEQALPFYKNSLIATIIALPLCIIGYNALVYRNNNLKPVLA
jgi:hypothetical protein